VRIAFLGDSLTEGSPGASYFRLLRRLLPDHELVNQGRAGDSVADLWARLQATGVERAGLAVIWIGTNDAAIGEWSSWALQTIEPMTWPAVLARIDPAYRRCVTFALESAPRALCVPPVVADELDEAWARRVADVGDVIRAAVASDPRAALLDLAPAFAAARAAGDGPLSFTIDGVHLSDAGAAVVAAAMAHAIEEVLGGGQAERA
jgi:lysophospholipase L1-like esterase